MSQSRGLWLLGAVAGVFLVVGGGLVHLAASHHTLRVHVKDHQGAVAGAWVALNDRNVQSTGPDGIALFKGRRFRLDSSVLTVSDPSLNNLHLSQTLRTEISWNPLRNETSVEVQLPLVELNSPVGQAGRPGAPEMDLPIFPGSSTVLESNAPLGNKLDEEELNDPTSSMLPYQSLKSLTEVKNQDAFVCALAGFARDFCGPTRQALKPPLRDPAQVVAVAEELVSGKLSEIQLAETQNKEQPSSEQTDASTIKSTNKGLLAPAHRPVRVDVVLSGKPLEGALVYMSRLKDNRVRELGRTKSDGVVLAKSTSEFWGETVTVFHSCCAPKTISGKLTKQSGEDRVRVEMQPGTGTGVLVQQEAYGHLRKVGTFELAGVTGKLAVSGQDGFALYNSSKTPEHQVNRVLLRSAKPEEFFVRHADLQEHQTKPLTFVVAPDELYLPAMAVFEKQDGRSFQGVLKNSMLRRWRRDFMARLMQQTSLRSIVSTESEARIAAAGESSTDVVTNGWNQTQLAGEWDFLLAIDYDESNQSVSLIGKLSDGKTFFDRQMRFSKNSNVVPESIARQFFQAFVESIPFEAHVVKQSNQIVDLSFSSLSLFGLKENSPLALYQQKVRSDEEKSDELAALAVVVGADESTRRVKARITHWNMKARKTEVLPDVVKAVKISEEFYSKEMIKQSMSKAATKGSGRTY